MISHVKRILTASIGLPLLVVLIYLSPAWLFTMGMLFAALRGLHEFYAMIKPNPPQSIIFVNYLATASLFTSVLVKGFSSLAIIPLFIILPLALFAARYRKKPPSIGDIGRVCMGPFYIGVPLLLLAAIFSLPGGQWWVFFILAVIFAGDTGSFYIGRSLGHHKLCRISPGKTWEGAIGGLLSNIAAGGVFGYLFFPSLSVVAIMLLAIGMGISGQIGDLAESMLKRISRVKDSGAVLPGHGGLLDRIDSLLFSIPVLYLYLNYMTLVGSPLLG
ncbi:MAG: phosphatidate cytidylyltransferase [Thermodesulfobacteriota bacterium]